MPTSPIEMWVQVLAVLLPDPAPSNVDGRWEVAEYPSSCCLYEGPAWSSWCWPGPAGWSGSADGRVPVFPPPPWGHYPGFQMSGSSVITKEVTAQCWNLQAIAWR